LRRRPPRSEEIEVELSAAVFGFALACLLSLLITPIVVRFAERRFLFDRPAPHKHPTRRPQIGGLAMLGALMLSLLGVRFSFAELGAASDALLRGVIAGGSLVAILGLIDDLQGSRPWMKLCVQVLALALLQLHTDVLGLHAFSAAALVGIVAMLLWMLGLTNAMNLIDGVDGLAAGLAAISGVGLLSLAWAIGAPGPALPAAALVGACLGFLRSNRPPAKIIMGDTGSMLLGFVLAATGASIYWLRPGPDMLLALFLISWVPCLDTSFAVLRRAVRHRSIFAPDRRHLHHRLLESGLSPRYVSLLLCALGSIGAAAGVHIAQDGRRWPWALAVLLATLPLGFALASRSARSETTVTTSARPAVTH
jgi:UDP-N-acetylmuramyl pentapeptide phosphotransferase/UDP-N-acetylglucosamine-1-phosphate transferase